MAKSSSPRAPGLAPPKEEISWVRRTRIAEGREAPDQREARRRIPSLLDRSLIDKGETMSTLPGRT